MTSPEHVIETKYTKAIVQSPVVHDKDDDVAEEKTEEIVLLKDCVDLTTCPEELQEVFYVGTMGKKVTTLSGIEACLALKKLHVRSNVIRSMAGLEHLHQLEQLELYDNHLKGISDVRHFQRLQILDLSFNHIRDIPDLSAVSGTLTELYVANNKLTTVGVGLGNLGKLEKLDLGANRIREIDGLDGLVCLKELWLGKNKITTIGTGLRTLTALEKLSIQSNRLTSIIDTDAQLATNVHLVELYLSHNGLTSISGLGHLSKLEILDVGANALEHLADLCLDRWTNLTDLWINHNEILDLGEVAHLARLPKLDTLYLEFNPLAKDFEYRKVVQRTLPELGQLDATPIRR